MGTEGGPGFYGSTSSGIPIQHLDYKYVEKCSDAKELEKILKVLRSGEEGNYPELIEFTEKRLETVNPASRALRKDLPVKSLHDLEKPERDEINDDIEGWMNDITQLDTSLKSSSDADPTSDFLPPIRSTKTVGSATTGGSHVSGEEQRTQEKKKGAVAPRSYQEWDKFDPDEEVRALEEKEEAKVREKKEKARLNTREAKLTTDLKPSGKTDQELTFLAGREKDKGNDAFRSGDYKESMVYYTRSIELKPTAAAYNNRALAEIKLCEYAKAIQDCNTVIFMEPDNLKAFLRRAIAAKHTGKVNEAQQDLDKVLEIEPNNKRAKELLEEINEQANAPPTKGRPPNGTVLEEGSVPPTHQVGQRLKIIEVDSDDEDEADADNDKQQDGTANTTNGINNGVNRLNGDVNESAEQGDPSQDNSDGNAIGKSEIGNGMDSGVRDSRDNLTSSVESRTNTPETSSEETPSNTQELNPSAPSTVTPTTVTPMTTTPSTTTAASSQVLGPCEVNPQGPVKHQREIPGVAARAKDEGTKLYKLGRYAEAAEKYTEAIEILWKDNIHFTAALASLLYNRAASLGRIGDTSGCIKDCTTSLDIAPGAIKPLLKRAEQQEHLEKYKEAHFDYQAVLRQDPTNQQALRGNTRVNNHLSSMHGPGWRNKITETKPDEVTSQALLDNEPPPPPPSISPQAAPRSTSDATKSTESVLNVKKAEPALSTKAEAVLSPAEKFQQCKERGNNYVKQGKHQEAVGCYTECIAVDPKEVVSYTNRALCYLKLDKNDLAEKDGNTALELQADNVKALYRRALARKALGRYDTAAKDLLTLIKIDPKNTSGKKELDTVLELCRKERREAQKTQPPLPENKKTAKLNAGSKGERKGETKNSTEARRRRVVIDEVNNDEDSEEEDAVTKKAPCPAAKKPTTSQHGKGKGSKDQHKSSTNTTHTAKGSKQKKIVLNKATPYDFFQAWNTVKRNDLSSYAEILRQLDPKLLPKVLSNKLDADMFRNVIGAISHQLLPCGEERLAFEILQYVCQAQRFDMAIMFLGRQDIQDLEDVFERLGTASNVRSSIDAKTFASIKNKYKV